MKNKALWKWILPIFFLLMGIGAPSLVPKLSMILCAALCAPIEPLQNFLIRFKIKGAIKALLVAILFIVGVMAFPPSDSPDTGNAPESSSSVPDAAQELESTIEEAESDVVLPSSSPEQEEQPESSIDAESSSHESDMTMGQKNALDKAKSYLNFSAFSYDGLIDQLEYEKFTIEEATYAVDNCGADWNEQAAKKAQDYMDFSSFSREGLIDQLEFEGFTSEQAIYGADSVYHSP